MFRRSQRYALYHALRFLPDMYRLQRIVDLRLIDLLSALHAADQRIDLVALLAKGHVVLVSGARFTLRRLRGLLQLGNCGRRAESGNSSKFRPIRQTQAPTEPARWYPRQIWLIAFSWH